MQFGSLSRLLHSSAPLGHLVWRTGTDPGPSMAELRPRWARAGLPPGADSLPLALEQAIGAWLGVPLLERSGVFWLAPPFSPRLAELKEALSPFRGWELHLVPVRADPQTLAALRASAARALSSRLSAVCAELESQLAQPRIPAALLLRRLDALERLRAQDRLNAEHLSLEHPGLAAHLEDWTRRVDAALCARIVA